MFNGTLVKFRKNSGKIVPKLFFSKEKNRKFYSHSADGPHSPLYKKQLRSCYLQKFVSEGAQIPQSISKTDPTVKLSLHTIYYHKIIMFTKKLFSRKEIKFHTQIKSVRSRLISSFLIKSGQIKCVR